MKIKDVRERLCWSMKEATSFLEIPYRTWQHWEGGTRTLAPWMEKLIVFRLEYEIKNKEEKKKMRKEYCITIKVAVVDDWKNKDGFSMADIFIGSHYGKDEDYLVDSNFYYFTFKSEESASDFLEDIDMDIDVEENDIDDDGVEENEENDKVVGRFWSNSEMEIIEVDKKLYVLNTPEWDGEQYHDCWQVADTKGLYEVGDDKFRIKPLYKEIDEDEFIIIDYEIVSY